MPSKLFLLVNSLAFDGIGRALLLFLSTIDFEHTEVHIGYFDKREGISKYLPSAVRVHRISGIDFECPSPSISSIINYIRNKSWKRATRQLLLWFQCKLNGCSLPHYRYIFRDVDRLDMSFDEAHAFHGPMQKIDYYVCEKVNARKKYGWIHVDVSKMLIDDALIRRIYHGYDMIFVVSKAGKLVFDNKFPEFRNVTQVYYHSVNKSNIQELSAYGQTFSDDFPGERILTVGRIAREKGQREAIQALSELVNKGYQVKWYFVGEGDDQSSCVKLAESLGLDKYVCFLGFHANPYGFMRDCDIYVQPSHHEGFCLSLAEALSFDTPIVTTSFLGAKEQLLGRDNAVIVGDGCDTLSHGIMKFLTH